MPLYRKKTHRPVSAYQVTSPFLIHTAADLPGWVAAALAKSAYRPGSLFIDYRAGVKKLTLINSLGMRAFVRRGDYLVLHPEGAIERVRQLEFEREYEIEEQ